MDQQELDELLDRYLNGTCTTQEREELKAWFDEQSSTGSWAWKSMAQKEAVRTMLKSGLDSRMPALPTQSLFSRPLVRTMIGIASLILVGFLVSQLLTTNHVVYRLEFTQQGETKEVRLPDGSIAILNVSTQLKFPEKFNDTREVVLQGGEVYFQVKEDAQRPFIVTTGAVKTRVLGTAFNVRAYPFLNDVRVSLAHGKVEVSQSTNSYLDQVTLSPNQQAIIQKDIEGIKTVPVEMDQLLSWKSGGIHFDNDELKVVVKLLEEKYGVVISLGNGIGNGKYLTADFEPTEGLHTILDAIAATFGMRYIETDNTILLTF